MLGDAMKRPTLSQSEKSFTAAMQWAAATAAGTDYSPVRDVLSRLQPRSRQRLLKYESLVRLENIHLYDRELDSSDLVTLAKALKESKVLQRTSLWNVGDDRHSSEICSKHSAEDGDSLATTVANALMGNKTLKKLEIAGCGVSKGGARAIARLLLSNENIEILDLKFSSIDDEGVEFLCDALKVNKSLQILDLSSCKISDEGAKYLSSALLVNTSLHTLVLKENYITLDGCKNIVTAMCINSTLQSLALEGNDTEAVDSERAALDLLLNTEIQNGVLKHNGLGCPDEPKLNLIREAATSKLPIERLSAYIASKDDQVGRERNHVRQLLKEISSLKNDLDRAEDARVDKDEEIERLSQELDDRDSQTEQLDKKPSALPVLPLPCAANTKVVLQAQLNAMKAMVDQSGNNAALKAQVNAIGAVIDTLPSHTSQPPSKRPKIN